MSNERILLEGCIKQFKETNEIELNDGEIFELFSMVQITKNRDLTHDNILNSIVDGGNDGGIDSIIILINDQLVESIDQLEEIKFNNKTKSRFIISQCKKEKSFREDPLDKLITTFPILFDLERNETELLSRFNSSVVELALLLRNVWEKTAIGGGNIALDVVYVCNATKIQINNVFSNKVNQLKELLKEQFSIEEISFTNYSSVELLKLYQEHRTTRLTLEFKEQPLSTSYDDNGIGYVGMIKLSKFKDFLTSNSGEIRDDLFESNIRHFQGGVDVNKKIKHTLENISASDFWWLNNGITIIAELPNQVGNKLSIENTQIVNGLQTSYSIFNSYNGNSQDNRSVLVKVLINNNKEIIDNIIASTNSQNPVSATLLRATEESQRNLEIFFLNNGYFYDRRKNYYKNQGKPSARIFGIQYTAQSVYSIVFDNPHSSRAKPTSILKDNKIYKQIFNPNFDFNLYLDCCLIHKKSINYWLAMDDQSEKNKVTNFKLHISWLVPKMILDKLKLNAEEIIGIDLSDYTIEIYMASVAFLISGIDKYIQDNVESNLINMAKSKDFTLFLSTEFVNMIAKK